MTQSTFDEMVEFLDLSYKKKEEIVPCLLGPVGIGKTQAVLQHAKNIGVDVVTIIASTCDPTEIIGMAMPNHETHSMDIYDHSRISSMKDGDILFFDELFEADQAVLSACLTLIESRILISGKKLPNVQIVAASNPTVQPKDIKPSIRQRFLFRSFDLDINGAKQFFIDKYSLDLKDVANNIETDSNSYNILSQRSVTKMVDWMLSTDDPFERNRIAEIIDDTWHRSLGTTIQNAILARDRGNKEIDSVIETISKWINIPEELLATGNIEEIVKYAAGLPIWSRVEEDLKSISIEEE